jgi:uncharacterized protein with GYD domain
MPKYLIKASYSVDGLKGVMKSGGSNRVDAVTRAVTGLGGSIESFNFAFGGDDVYVIAEAPNNVAAAALAAAVGSSGALARYETVVLLSPAEIDEAMGMAVDYTPPGS